MEVFKTKEFKKAFWDWFDNVLTESERKAFYDYPMDMSELFFYNKIYSKSKN
jgi:hypothetical protein